ncbi:MAG: BamA/TamA family outer membrane protein [Rubrivivax sp.]|nr:BamA/TamA family outer membrane protein [Rubrivivax sp.]
MSRLRATAALAGALLLGGCALLPSAEKAPPAPAVTLATAQESDPKAPARGVVVEVQAPGPLKTLLERHLDLVRLGGVVAREEVDETEWSRLIDAAPIQVRELLQTEGYFNPAVTLTRAPGHASGEPDRVILTVEPGARARVASLTLEFDGALERDAQAGEAHAKATMERLRRAWELPVGSDFRNPAWSDAKASTLARLRGAGYATATWSGTGAEVDTERNEARLFLVADSGPLFRYGELQVEGLTVQDSETVSNLLAARRGAPVTEALLLDFQERLQKSGLFENVNVTLDTDPAQAGQARITARLRESPLQVYTVGLGISANTGARASVDHTYRRVFGFAATARNKIEIGQLHKVWNGELSTHPAEGLHRNLLGAAVDQLESSTDIVLSQRLRLGRTQDGQRIERLIFLEAERSTRQTHDNLVDDKAIALSLNYSGVWRDLDSVVLPTQGLSISGQVGLGRSHGTDAEPGPFARLYLRLTGYLPVGKVWYGQARVEFGQVFLRPNGVVPDSQQFRAGGDGSVRGYGYRSLGPLEGGVVSSGNVMYTTSIELARPIVNSMPSLWGAVFVDAGNAGDSFAGLRPAVGLGVGLRWRSPVGPLRLDWAYGREIRQARLHFSIGIAF